MAIEGVMLRDSSTTALGNLATNQFYAYNIVGNKSGNLSVTVGQAIFGVLQNAPYAGQAADICFEGVTKAQAGGALSAGNQTQVGSTGQFILYTSGGGNVAVGVAMEAAVANQTFTMRVVPSGG